MSPIHCHCKCLTVSFAFFKENESRVESVFLVIHTNALRHFCWLLYDKQFLYCVDLSVDVQCEIWVLMENYCSSVLQRLGEPSVGTEAGLLPALSATVYNSGLKPLIFSVFLESVYQSGSELMVLRRLDFIESKPEFWRPRPKPNYFDMGLTRSEQEVLERGRCQQRRLEQNQMVRGERYGSENSRPVRPRCLLLGRRWRLHIKTTAGCNLGCTNRRRLD